MNIGTHKQLFMDDRFIESPDGVTLCMNPPVQHQELLLTSNQSWERNGLGAYNTVFRESDGKFRMWYDGSIRGGLPKAGARRLCYAESADGLHWEKPSLGLIEFEGSKDNNIVAPRLELQSMQGATVFRDERAPAEERYKLWSKFRPTDEQVEKGIRPGLWAMYSADGVHWREYPDQPNPPRTSCDTQNMFFWDDRIEQYVGYTRVRETQHRSEAAEAAGGTGARNTGRYRAVGRITSPDFRNWSELQIVFEADDEDLNIPVPYQRDDPRPNIDLYTSCAQKYAEAQDAYFMFPSVYYHWGENDFPGTMDVQLLTSRDGIEWQRAGDRRPFLRHGLDGSICSGMVFANPWLIPMGDELWFYFRGTATRHGQEEPERRTGIYRATMRRDGFVSADAGYRGGEFTTPVIQFGGDQLELNMDGSAGGWLKVEIQDPHGQPLEGFAQSDADGMLGNAINKIVTWRGSRDLSALSSRPIRLRFIMRDLKLYAFQFPDGDS